MPVHTVVSFMQLRLMQAISWLISAVITEKRTVKQALRYFVNIHLVKISLNQTAMQCIPQTMIFAITIMLLTRPWS